jgi:hypothetical protein
MMDMGLIRHKRVLMVADTTHKDSHHIEAGYQQRCKRHYQRIDTQHGGGITGAQLQTQKTE